MGTPNALPAPRKALSSEASGTPRRRASSPLPFAASHGSCRHARRLAPKSRRACHASFLRRGGGAQDRRHHCRDIRSGHDRRRGLRGDAGPSGWNKGPWIVEAYFGAPPDEANVRALVAAAAGDAAARAATFGRVDERDWVAASLEGLKPVRAGRFIVHGAHGRDAVKANDIAIEIEAALAFGTGHHGSTRGCLHMLDRVARKRRPRAILDLGTGSGVLAIAAAKLFKRKIHAGDIDVFA